MPAHEVTCPVCNADLPLSGDERRGDEVFCTFCGAPCRLTFKPKVPGGEEEASAEEDF